MQHYNNMALQRNVKTFLTFFVPIAKLVGTHHTNGSIYLESELTSSRSIALLIRHVLPLELASFIQLLLGPNVKGFMLEEKERKQFDHFDILGD